MNTKNILATLCICIFTVQAKAGTTNSCSAPEASQFDFWIGDWDLTYNDSVHSSNKITKDMDGCVIYEHFDDPSQSFRGNSWSVYNPQLKKWQQTWVDNQGGYIVLTGNFEHQIMTLSTEARKTTDGKWIRNRMLFYNITKNSFDWNWEATMDEGKTWTVKWKIHYDRR